MNKQLLQELGLEDDDIAVEEIEGLILKRRGLADTNSHELAAKLMNQFTPIKNQMIMFGQIPPDYTQLVELGLKLLPGEITSRAPLFDQMIANYYQPGEGLIPHIDLAHRFEDGILIANLQGTCVMSFTRGDQKAQVFLDVGDIIILHGPARWDWKHGIEPRVFDFDNDGKQVERTERVSLTLRKLKPTM